MAGNSRRGRLFEPMRIGFENGKAVMKPMKKRNDLDHLAISLSSPKEKPIIVNITHNHHYKEKFEDIKNMMGEFKYRVSRQGDFDFGECGNCGKKWYKEYQQICEGCGVSLSRM